MLKELEKRFTQLGWYDGNHTFLLIKLEGGFEAFSGRASETWEYRWVVSVIENKEIGIPSIKVEGKRFEELDDVCAKVLKELNKEKNNG
jgi:hypothetical protein